MGSSSGLGGPPVPAGRPWRPRWPRHAGRAQDCSRPNRGGRLAHAAQAEPGRLARRIAPSPRSGKPLELPQPQYTEAARAAGIEGKVRVQLFEVKARPAAVRSRSPCSPPRSTHDRPTTPPGSPPGRPSSSPRPAAAPKPVRAHALTHLDQVHAVTRRGSWLLVRTCH